MSSGKLFQAIIERGGERLIIAEVIAENDDQAFEMISERLKHRGFMAAREGWIKSGGLLASVSSEYYIKRDRPPQGKAERAVGKGLKQGIE